jgi:hypothetical protein
VHLVARGDVVRDQAPDSSSAPLSAKAVASLESFILFPLCSQAAFEACGADLSIFS